MQHSFRTSPPPTYITPSGEEMKEMASKVGLSGFSRDLVADLCNLAADGKINPPSSYREQVQKKAEETLPAPDSAGQWSFTVKKNGKKESVSTKNRYEAITAKTDESMRYHQNVCDFLQAIDLSHFPGSSPLEQAMSMLKMLSKQSGGSGGEGGEPLPIFQDSERPEGVAENLQDTMDMVDSLSEEELDMLDPDGNSHEVMKAQDGQGEGHKSLDRLKVAEDIVAGSDKRVMLDISRKIDQFSKMQVRKQKLVEQDPAGEEIRQRPIKNLGELPKVSKTAWATRQQSPTYFLYQAIMGQLPVRERVTRIERKQAIFILVDGSGSMKGKKHWKATGVVMNRLKAVLEGDAEVWLGVFDTELSNADHAATPEEARELIKKFYRSNYSGGGTNIATAVKKAHKMIEEMIKSGAALWRPEIVVLTDEDKSASGVKKTDIPGTKVHGFAMEVANSSLISFARSTGGVGVDKF